MPRRLLSAGVLRCLICSALYLELYTLLEVTECSSCTRDADRNAATCHETP